MEIFCYILTEDNQISIIVPKRYVNIDYIINLNVKLTNPVSSRYGVFIIN